MQSTAYVIDADTSEIYYIVSGPAEIVVQQYIETEFGAKIFDEWQVCWTKFEGLKETTDTEEIEINEKGENV